MSFRPKRRITKKHHNDYLNPAHYVPSNTSVRAVILGGADADASVNGQSKNNGVMLFKFLEDGTLANGQRSRLRGCRVSANSLMGIFPVNERLQPYITCLVLILANLLLINESLAGCFLMARWALKANP